jgi:hypothetical protein
MKQPSSRFQSRFMPDLYYEGQERRGNGNVVHWYREKESTTMLAKYGLKVRNALAVGLFALGAVGIPVAAHAQAVTPPPVETPADLNTVDTAPDAAEAASTAPDTDNVQSGDQSGNQVEDGLPDLPGAGPEAPGQ